MKYKVGNLLIALCGIVFFAHATQQEPKAILEEKLAVPVTVVDKSTEEQELVYINYTNKPLPEIVNELAAQLGINIIMPQPPKAQSSLAFYGSKLTYHLPDKVTLKQAWEIVIDALHLLGYMTHPQGDMIAIVQYPNMQNAARQPLTLYRNIPPDQLPSSPQIIRYIMHLKNLDMAQSEVPLKIILKDMLSKDASIITIKQSNAFLITDRADNVKAAMKIIAEADAAGLLDAIEVIPLYYTSSSLIDDLFNKQLFPYTKIPTIEVKKKKLPYFPQNTKVIGLERNNSVVIMGTTRSIDIVKDFIIKYIDRPLESGDSMLHVYDLQYLNATEFAKVLATIVSGEEKQQYYGQRTTKEVQTGPMRYFEDVVIVAEITSEAEKLTPESSLTKIVDQATTSSGKGGAPQIGGNRLVIAARKKDWVRIKKLIEQLDKPQLQVAVEALILDLRFDTAKILGMQTRNKSGFNNSTAAGVNWQAAHLTSPILKPQVDGMFPANALMADLLETMTGTGGIISNIASQATPGSFIVSFKDQENTFGVWSILQVLNRFSNSTILAQPFLIAQNHQKAWVFTEDNRYRTDETQGGSGQIARVTMKDIKAGISLDILPHISEGGNVNLQIIVQINQFIEGTGAGPSGANKQIRVIQTNANIGNGEVLVLGGLTRDEKSTAISESPLLGQIPIVGWFFKRESKAIIKNHLMVLISPTIVEPYRKGGMDVFTQGKVAHARADIRDDLDHENLRDPITRWFFKPDIDCPEKEIDHYLEQHYYAEEPLRIQQTLKAREAQQNEQLESEMKQLKEQEEKLKKLVQNERNPLVIEQPKDQLILDS